MTVSPNVVVLTAMAFLVVWMQRQGRWGLFFSAMSGSQSLKAG